MKSLVTALKKDRLELREGLPRCSAIHVLPSIFRLIPVSKEALDQSHSRNTIYISKYGFQASEC
jgi:hypothetical protein